MNHLPVVLSGKINQRFFSLSAVMKHQQVPDVSGIIKSRIFCGWENQVKNFVSDASGKIKSENCVCKNKLIIFQLKQHHLVFVSGKIE